MKKISIVFIFLLFALSLFSQIASIKENQSGVPLEFVTLISEYPKAFATTNVKGQVNLTSFKGSEKIEIRLLGYKTEMKSYAEIEAMKFEIILSSSTISIDEITVSANRWRQKTGDVPSKIISISAKEISLQNPQTAADLLAASGKVFIQKSQQGGRSPMIRGFATNRLIYTVDGVRMNNAIFRGGNIQNVISLDPFATEKTEILFGPGSVIYGSDAIGGVMSFQTLKPQLSLDEKTLVSGKSTMRYASANSEKTGHFDVNLGWSKWAMITSFSANNYGDLKMGKYGPAEYLRHYYVQRVDSVDVIVTNDDPRIQKPSGYSQMNLMQKILYQPNEKWEIQYGFHYSETSDYSRYDRHIRYKDGLPRYGEWYYGPQIWMMNNLSISHNGDNFLYDQFTIRLAQQYFEESRIDRNINKPDRHIRIEKVDAYSVNFDFNKSIGNIHKLFYGMEAVQNYVNSTGVDENIKTGIKIPGPSRYPQSDWASYGIYISDQIKLSEKFLIHTGARYNHFLLNAKFDTSFYPFPFTTAKINNGTLTGSLGFVFKPAESWIFSSNLATAFRSPNVDDIGKVFDSEPGSVVVPNPDLKAEYAYNADIGIAKVFGNFAKIDFTAFYTMLNNAMVRRDFTLNGSDSIMYDGSMSKVQAIQNAAVANVYGVQAGLEIKLPADFKFASDISYQKGEEELDDGTKSPSRHAAPVFGQTSLSYVTEKLKMQVYCVYSGEKKFEDLPEEDQGKTEIYAVDKNGNPFSPKWYTLNFKAMYKLNANFTISAGLENITDQLYRSYSSGIAAPGRNFILSVKVIF